MKIALNDQNVILKQLCIGTANCYRCCFSSNWSLCEISELRDRSICRTLKIFDNTELKDVFKL